MDWVLIRKEFLFIYVRNTRKFCYIITIKVPVAFMARYVMVLRGATSLQGPTPSNAPSNDVAPLKTIKYKRHKNNWYIGSFMYPSTVV